jgi:DNA-damage-inducible protein J
MATLQVRMDDNIKIAADSLFNQLGLDTSTAVRMFISASLENHGLPFDVKRKAPAQDFTKAITSVRYPVFGSGKGKMWFADDFDAPLDELKEYME